MILGLVGVFSVSADTPVGVVSCANGILLALLAVWRSYLPRVVNYGRPSHGDARKRVTVGVFSRFMEWHPLSTATGTGRRTW